MRQITIMVVMALAFTTANAQTINSLHKGALCKTLNSHLLQDTGVDTQFTYNRNTLVLVLMHQDLRDPTVTPYYASRKVVVEETLHTWSTLVHNNSAVVALIKSLKIKYLKYVYVTPDGAYYESTKVRI